MSCKLSRSEIIHFNIPVVDQRCQAVCKEGNVCGDLLTAHPAGPDAQDKEEQQSCWPKCCLRLLILICFGFFVFLIVSSGLILGTTYYELAVETDDVTNLKITGDTLIFGSHLNELYLYTVNENYDDDVDTYSTSTFLSEFDCQGDDKCIDTVDLLSTCSDSIAGAGIPSLIFSSIILLLLIPRTLSMCLHKSKCSCEITGGDTFHKLFVRPMRVLYVILFLDLVIFVLCITFVSIYNATVPSNTDMYELTLFFINSNSDVCDPALPCSFDMDQASFYQNIAFFVVTIVLAAITAIIAVAMRYVNFSCSGIPCQELDEDAATATMVCGNSVEIEKRDATSAYVTVGTAASNPTSHSPGYLSLVPSETFRRQDKSTV